jgi:aspartate aminotransferase
LSRLHQAPFEAGDLVLTCGAGGALNVIFKALLDPGEEVVIFAPYFPEYLFYLDNHGGVPRVVETDARFQLDLNRLEAALNPRTRIVLINSPNNPTGQIYGAETLKELGLLLDRHSRNQERPVYLLADEPYRQIVYDGVTLPDIFGFYPHTLLATSFSKDLSIPGERIGYAAVSPRTPARAEVAGGMVLANRILGYVNAPALMQRVVANLLDVSVDVSYYAQRRDLFMEVLEQAGYEFVKIEGLSKIVVRA